MHPKICLSDTLQARFLQKYPIPFEISKQTFCLGLHHDSASTAIHPVLTAGKGNGTRSATDLLVCLWSRVHTLQKPSDGFWITNLGAGSILAVLAKCSS